MISVIISVILEFLGGVKKDKWTVIFYYIKDNKLNLSDSVIILLKKKETYYIKETSLLSLLSVKEMRQLLFYKIYEDIINSSHYLCYFFIRWVLWSFILIKWINPYREENKSLYLAYLSNMNYPLREVISVSLKKPLYLI